MTATAERLVTEFPFVLPRGFVDMDGNVHREGVMRLATARDEIAPLRDPRVRENPAYLTVLLLSRVTRFTSLPAMSEGVIEGMFATDLAFLQDHYKRINSEGQTRAQVSCPSCDHAFQVDVSGGRPGES